MKTAADFRRAELRRKLRRELRLVAFYSDRRRLVELVRRVLKREKERLDEHKDIARILRRTLREERKGQR